MLRKNNQMKYLPYVQDKVSEEKRRKIPTMLCIHQVDELD